MKKFEYDVVFMKTDVTDEHSQGAVSSHIRKTLNAMGTEGWELVSASQDLEQIRFFLKREISSGASLASSSSTPATSVPIGL